MGSRHSKAVRPGRRYGGAVAGALIGTALASWSIASVLDSSPHPQVATQVAGPHAVNQDGRIVAVDAGSVTAVGPDGVPHTFLVTPDTAAVTTSGGQSGLAGSVFAVDDEVSIVGEVRNGTPVATAVAAHDVSHLDGPPMDFPAA